MIVMQYVTDTFVFVCWPYSHSHVYKCGFIIDSHSADNWIQHQFLASVFDHMNQRYGWTFQAQTIMRYGRNSRSSWHVLINLKISKGSSEVNHFASFWRDSSCDCVSCSIYDLVKSERNNWFCDQIYENTLGIFWIFWALMITPFNGIKPNFYFCKDILKGIALLFSSSIRIAYS